MTYTILHKKTIFISYPIFFHIGPDIGSNTIWDTRACVLALPLWRVQVICQVVLALLQAMEALPKTCCTRLVSYRSNQACVQGNWHMVQQLKEVVEEQCLDLSNLSNHQHPFADHHLPLRHCLEEWEQHLINAGYIKIISYPISDRISGVIVYDIVFSPMR